MGRGLSDLQRTMLAMAYVNHRDRPESKLGVRVAGPEDGPPFRETKSGAMFRSTHDYPYASAETIHLFYWEALAWPYGFRAYPNGGALPWRNDPAHRVFDVEAIGRGRFRAAQVAVTRAMRGLDRRGLAIYANWRSPTGLALTAAGAAEGARLYETGGCDRALIAAYEAEPLFRPRNG